jgi:hypothetical protein
VQPAAQATSVTQQPASRSSKKETAKQRKVDTATEMLQVAMAAMETAGVRCV